MMLATILMALFASFFGLGYITGVVAEKRRSEGGGVISGSGFPVKSGLVVKSASNIEGER